MNLTVLTDDKLLDLLFDCDDWLPRRAVDEFTRRGERMIWPLWQIVKQKHYWEEDNGVWAPIHAVFILGAIGGREAVVPLITALRFAYAYECDSVWEALPSIFGRLGEKAIEPLKKLVLDMSNNWFVRGVAMEGLASLTIGRSGLERKIFDFIAAYHLLTILNFFLAGVLVFWFCRLIEISKAGSIIAGFSYAFSHAMMWAGSILVFANLFPLIPLFFICILKIYENDKRRLFALLAVLTLAFGWLGAFTEGVFYLLAVGFMFALFLDSSSAIAFLRVWSRSPKGETCGFPMGQTGIQSACPVASERSEDWCGEGDIPEPASLGRAKKAKRRITELLANFKATKWCIAIGIISLILASPWFLPTFNFATALSSRASTSDPAIGCSSPDRRKLCSDAIWSAAASSLLRVVGSRSRGRSFSAYLACRSIGE